MAKSPEYTDAFFEALRVYTQHDDPDLSNPYKKGTDEYRGWEDAVKALVDKEITL